MKLFILLLSLFIVENGISQLSLDSTLIPTNVLDLCDEISQDSVVESERISKSAFHSEQYSRFQKIMNLSNDSVLFQLTNHTSPAVRGYAYYGLIERDSKLFMQAIKLHENDSSEVKTLNGCIGGRTTVYILAVRSAYYKNKSAGLKCLSKDDEKYLQNVHQAEMQRMRNAMRKQE
jgi:hypothetical protein